VLHVPRAARTWLYSRVVQQELRFFISRLGLDDLETLRGLLESGRVTPVIDRHYPLDDAAEAIRYLETGRARGKVIVVMRPEVGLAQGE
jgi:NADPH:quinone reductase-like Zn-dependent oxidoreductase